MAPVELADLARRKRQFNERLRQGRAGFGGLPALHEPPHAVMGAAATLRPQALKQSPCGAALGFRQLAFDP